MTRWAVVRIALQYILFERGTLTVEAKAWLHKEQPDVCVFDHSHRPTIDQSERKLLFNPGSAGPKRFSLLCGRGIVTMSGDRILPQSARLDGGRPGSDRQMSVADFTTRSDD